MATKKNETKITEYESIMIRGAREHNLKNIDLDIPKKKLVVITGVSGSGKSSLAFDTLFAEGQRRYVESLSAYARQFLGQAEKPDFDTIRGLSPTIAIEQKSASKNPRSTVGTITEVYDYLRVLFARVGVQYCHVCGKKVGRGDAASMVEQILQAPENCKFLLLAPIVEGRKGEHREIFEQLRGEGYGRIRIDGVLHKISDVQSLAKNKKHDIEVVIDRLQLQKNAEFKTRLVDSVETSLKAGKGKLIFHIEGQKDVMMSEERSCCGHAFPELEPTLFSFNSPRGMCVACNGLGSVMQMDPEKIIPDGSLSIREGAIIPWKNIAEDDQYNDSWGAQRFKAMEQGWGINFDLPWDKLPKKHRDMILYGDGADELTVNWKGGRSEGTYTFHYEGLLNAMMRRYLKTQSESMKTWYGKFMSTASCSQCHGRRLKDDILSVKIKDHSIFDVTALSIEDCQKFLTQLQLKGNDQLIAGELLKEILSRVGFLMNVGLGYLSMDRKGPTLSGGEAQRIRLASQIGSELTGVLYILDEPSIGLHQRDNQKLIKTLCHLRDIGNTLLVVEHDQETMEYADWIIDIGPGAGVLGGKVIAEGTPSQIKKNKESLTGKYLSGRFKIERCSPLRKIANKNQSWIEVIGASENNLQNIDVKIPLGVLTSVTGVSGAGKSTLINQVLLPALEKKLHQSSVTVGAHKEIRGLEYLDKVINIDQKAIGRTPRSNPATYTKVFDLIRDFYAMLPEAKLRGFDKGRFSFNVKGGRCENCQGDGYITVEMHFLADVFVPCDVCHGKRFNDATLEVKYKGHSIADVLDMPVNEARELFAQHKKIVKILDTLLEVGLSYVKLGQPATTLSGGEAQRIKLARELAKVATGRTLYILDEPTTGLHFQDIQHLLQVLNKLVDAGNTVVVIEHNLDVIKTSDWIIDIGPEGGIHGGKLVACGTPEVVAKSKNSHTGKFLLEELKK